MPIPRRIPDNKRRSRTGCIPCRRRRRKCDENRPQCGNCAERNVACEFKEWTFVSSVSSSHRKPEKAQEKVVEDAASQPMPESWHFSPGPVPASGPVALVFDNPAASRQTDRLEAVQHTTPRDTQLITRTSNPQQSNDSHQIPTPSQWNEVVLSEQISSERQTALLRFRYQIVPWLEADAPRSTFGPEMMMMAAAKSVITDIAIWVAMCRTRKTQVSTSEDEDIHRVQQLQQRLLSEDAFVADVGRSLLAISYFFYADPAKWGDLHHEFLDVRERCQFYENKKEPLRTLDRFHFKTELATSIMRGNTLVSLPIPLATTAAFVIPDLSITKTYNNCLTHLAACWRLLHEELRPLFEGTTSTQPPTQESCSSVWTRWGSLWARCVEWFQDRPLEMLPVLETPEVNNFSITSTAFTADIYSTAISVQANLAMHFSSLLLLSYRPRLAKLSSTPHHLVSKNWHAQKIAKIASWNHLLNQWDPVTVAILLHVARDLTYPSQQETLLSCLGRIEDAVKIPLQSEVTDLQQFWSSTRRYSAPASA